MDVVRSHKELRVWQLAMQLAKDVYKLTEQFPKKEEFRMTSQIVRAAVSIPANIAEGNARGTRRDYANFVSIARGSAAELETLLLLAKDIGLASEEAFHTVLEQTGEIGRMLNGLRRSLSPSNASTTNS
ncbi:MAG TPA: four helix bundle protein [Parvularculaceae bacterium]|nr:four helix bundle protein [Caulobacterales bacterium]HOP19266.1 four helix bundle protein [Amphiplicatus sp.]HPE30922.1 four helix bundle protein [Parvularculaceae bacterium]HRX40686.1 four helix bundle protein [Parvularculaceae bacterium]